MNKKILEAELYEMSLDELFHSASGLGIKICNGQDIFQRSDDIQRDILVELIISNQSN